MPLSHETMPDATLSTLFRFPLVAQESEYQLDKEYNLAPDGTIELHSSDANVRIVGSNRNTVHLKVYRKVEAKGISWNQQKFEVEVEEYNGNLKIREKQAGSVNVVGYIREDYQIKIEAPKGAGLRITGDDNDYIIQDINGAIEMNVDDGDAELLGCKGDYFKFNFDDRDLRMDEGKGTLMVNSDDGDVKIKNASFQAVNAKVDDGDIVLETALTDNGAYSFKGNDSNIVLNITQGGGDFEIKHEDSRVSSSGDFGLIEKDESYTRLSLASGDAVVKIVVAEQGAAILHK